jgi:hypothetical protein
MARLHLIARYTLYIAPLPPKLIHEEGQSTIPIVPNIIQERRGVPR